MRESVPVWTGIEAGSGFNSHDWLASYDRGVWWSRTSLVYSPKELRAWSGIWPRSGCVWNGRLYAHRMLARRTAGSGCSSWPTPQSYAEGEEDNHPPGLTPLGLLVRPDMPAAIRERKRKGQMAWTTPRSTDQNMDRRSDEALERERNRPNSDASLVLDVRQWPTPRSEDSESGGARHTRGTVDTLTSAARVDWLTPQSRDHKGVSQKVAKGLFTGGLPDQLAGLPAPARRNTSGKVPEHGSVVLCPLFVEALMGFPLGWTELPASEQIPML
jgi:hypothetical protein